MGAGEGPQVLLSLYPLFRWVFVVPDYFDSFSGVGN
jgi:hypothetical protein